MGRTALCLLAVMGRTCGAAAQPADCPSSPAATQTVPLQLDIAGLPGVPQGITGQIYADLPAPPGGIVCGPNRPAREITDVLAGRPGKVLGGPPSSDLLRGR